MKYRDRIPGTLVTYPGGQGKVFSPDQSSFSMVWIEKENGIVQLFNLKDVHTIPPVK